MLPVDTFSSGHSSQISTQTECKAGPSDAVDADLLEPFPTFPEPGPAEMEDTVKAGPSEADHTCGSTTPEGIPTPSTKPSAGMEKKPSNRKRRSEETSLEVIREIVAKQDRRQMEAEQRNSSL